jgi:(E)-4-hydroxy-3-methylbut-2-enyl-diphosphate synthase
MVKAGTLAIGAASPVSVQTMWKEPLRAGTIDTVAAGLEDLRSIGCDLVRFAAPDLDAADLLGRLARRTLMPLAADIHFDYRIALRILDHPIAKLRINPGTIGEDWKVGEVLKKARDRGVCIRIGVNAASLPRDLRSARHRVRAMLDAAEREMEILVRTGFHDAVFSLKSSDVDENTRANTMFARLYDFPLHIGVTEAGPLIPGIVQSAIGLHALLRKGIGDTIRVSLSAQPKDEVLAGVEILRLSGARSSGARVVSCPTCARSTFDVHGFYEEVAFFIQRIEKPVTLAIMGCPVNGPGEARYADIGITGAGKRALIFRQGEVVRRVDREEAALAFREEIERYAKNLDDQPA